MAKGGRLFDVSLTVSPIKDPTGLMTRISAIARDVTGRNEAERRLREAEARYRSIYENAAEGIFQTTLQGNLVTANPALALMTGYASSEEMVENISDLARQLYVDAEDRAEFVRRVRRDGSVSNFETRFCRRDGGTIWISMNARVLHDENGEPTGFEGTVQDISQRCAEKLILCPFSHQTAPRRLPRRSSFYLRSVGYRGGSTAMITAVRAQEGGGVAARERRAVQELLQGRLDRDGPRRPRRALAPG